MVALSEPLLGQGLYTAAEVALYARVPVQTVTRWLFGHGSRAAVMRPQLLEEERIVSFLDFVQTLAIRAIRLQYSVPLQRIRQAVDCASQKYGVDYPFARPHKTFLFGKDILIKLDDDRIVQVSGKHAGNQMLKEVVELYMTDLTFGTDGLAKLYRPFTWNNQTVTMNPQVRFGEPLITTCGYTARALWEAVQDEGGIDAVVEAYGVSKVEVELACRYFDHLQGNMAA